MQLPLLTELVLRYTVGPIRFLSLYTNMCAKLLHYSHVIGPNNKVLFLLYTKCFYDLCDLNEINQMAKSEGSYLAAIKQPLSTLKLAIQQYITMLCLACMFA